MKLANRNVLIVLVVLLAATVYGLVRTGREGTTPTANKTAGPDQPPLVDQTPLLTAQAFANMPTSAVELPFAQRALQLGDQEMDLAFLLCAIQAAYINQRSGYRKSGCNYLHRLAT